MAIFINDASKVIVQGMTGSEGTKHTRRMLASGTKVVGGVTPGKGGQSVEIDGHNLPVFNTVAEAMAATGANTSVVFVPPKFAKAAVIDAIDAKMPLVVVITEGIPVHDSAFFYTYAKEKGSTQIIGPNCPGLISPGKSNVGIIPADITKRGPIGLVSKSGTLTYQMMYELRDIGFSTAVGIGGDPVIGTTLPVFNTVAEAMAATGAKVSVVFVPPKFAKAAVIDAIDAKMPLVVVITEGIPVHDSAFFYASSLQQGTTQIIGPNCPGLISPEQSNVGIIPADITKRGPIGLVSKSGTLTYQMMYELRDIGFSTAVGIGGDPVIGTTHIDCLRAFQDDPETTAIVMIGEIGGDAEERAAAFISEYVTKPVVGYVAGFTAAEGKTMGHASAIVSGSSGTAQAKKDALEAAGVKVGQTPSETAQLMRDILGR